MPLNLATTAPGFTEAMQLMHKGEKAMLWVPPDDRLQGPAAGQKPETLVYEVEVVDIDAGAGDPARRRSAARRARRQTKSGHASTSIVRPGTGKDKPRPYDDVTFNYTGVGRRRPDVRHDGDEEAPGEGRRRSASRRRSRRC